MDLPRPLVSAPATDLRRRAGDDDRAAVCEQLAAHYALGRLREDELDARLDAAVAARTLLELHRLVGDLPAPAVPATAAPMPPGRSWSALDVLALLTVVGALGFAVLMAVLVGVAAPGVVLLACFGGGCVAAAGGAATAHLAHRARQRSRTGPQRPRIA